MSPADHPSTAAPRQWSPWRGIVAFGLVSLSADMVYEGLRSVSGPFLGSLGASALLVGLITGAGEALALVLRVLTGALADRSRSHWHLTIVGYALTAVCVPLLAIAPYVGAAGVATAATLILLERTGKAVRSPAKSALLAGMTARTGRGRGFGVHKALDQVGAFSGPLLLAAMLALTGFYWPGFALLAIPGSISLLLLVQLRRRVGPLIEADPTQDGAVPPAEGRPAPRLRDVVLGTGLPRAFYLFSLAVALTSAGLMTFGVISFRFVAAGLVPMAAAPLVYALAMAAAALAALATGEAFDRWGARVLLVVPVLVVVVPLTVFADHVGPVLLGVIAWGIATGVQDSTVKAYVAELVPVARRATAYGVFAALQGMGALAGGVLAGLLVTAHTTLLAAVIAVLQVVASALLLRTLRSARATEHTGEGSSPCPDIRDRGSINEGE